MKIFARIFFLFVLSDSVAQYTVGDLTRKFNDYYSIRQRKKIHLVLNQDKFSPGDTVYFKSYFLSEDLTGVPGNQLIELHLVNADGNSVFNLKFASINGIGKNQFVIPPALTQGYYNVTLYSSWMLNFDPSLFFKKRISIVERNALSVKKRKELRFAVEGGRLIAGLKNKVVVQAEANSVVQVIDASGVNVGLTRTDSTGVGTIIFTPGKDNTYFAQKLGDEKKISLPSVRGEGLCLSLRERKNSSIEFLVAPTADLQNKEFIAVVTARSKVRYSLTFRVEPGGVSLSVPKGSMPEGVAHLSLLDANGRLLASRDFYSQGLSPANADIKAEKKSFAPREKVKLEVSISDDKGQPAEGEFSIKAISRDLFDLEYQNSLPDELFIQSYLKDLYTINHSDLNWISKLDERLILNTEDIPWSEILMDKVVKPSYGLSNFIQMSGRVTMIDTSAAKLPDHLDIQFYLQRSKIQYQTTAENGRVWLALPALHDEDELLYLVESSYYINEQLHGEEVSGIKIRWENSLPKFQPADSFKASEQSDSYASFVKKNRLIAQSYSYYAGKEVPQTKDDSDNEFISADVTINVQEYTLFPTMADLIKEVIPYLQHRKIGHIDRVLASLNEDLASQSTGDPLYIIDGIATKNTDFFLALKPSELLSVKVIISSQKLKPLGMMGKNGIVIVHTKKGNVRESVDPSNLIQGLSRPLDFKARSYDSDSSKDSPDFRSTVHWSPSVKTNGNGKAKVEFYTSDMLGELSVRVDGITTQGIPFSKEVQLNVTNKK